MLSCNKSQVVARMNLSNRTALRSTTKKTVNSDTTATGTGTRTVIIIVLGLVALKI